MQNYEQWTRDEIARLQADADRATVEANMLQRTLDRWLALHGSQNDVSMVLSSTVPSVNSVTHRRTRGKAIRHDVHGNKNATALESLVASPDGLTTDELYRVYVERFGADYKRSSMRALLWHQKQIGKIDLRDGRYFAVHHGTK